MKQRKLPNLRIVLFLQAIPVVFVPIYFMLISMNVFSSLRQMFWFWMLWVAVTFFQSWLVKQVKAQTDECALQTLRTAESSCFQSAEIVIVFVAILLAANQSEPVFPVLVEHLPVVLTILLFLIYLERAILFAYWDKKGLPPC